MRRRIAHDHFHVFVECLQQPVETQRGAEAVAIGANVRSNRKAILFFNQFNYLAKHVGGTDFSACDFLLLLSTQTGSLCYFGCSIFCSNSSTRSAFSSTVSRTKCSAGVCRKLSA